MPLTDTQIQKCRARLKACEGKQNGQEMTSLPLSSRAQAVRRHGMVSGCVMPVRAGNKVLAVLELYCHYCLRENREAMAAVETVASALGRMLARSYEHGRSEKLYRQQEILLNTIADGMCGLDGHGLVSFANPAAARLLGASASSLIGKPVPPVCKAIG